MLDARWEVYALVDPRDNLVKYIGRTFVGSGRYYAHLKGQDGNGAARSRWLGALRRRGLAPQITIIDWTFSFGGICRAEKRWIDHARRVGWPLKNGCRGGAGGIPLKLRQRLRHMRHALKKR